MIITHHTIFGWLVTQTVFADGDTYSAVYREDVRSELSQSWMPWTKGERIFAEHPAALTDPEFLAQRGKFVAKVAFAGKIFPRGRYTVQAVGDAENWCLNHALNGNDAPELNCTWLQVGDTYATSVGDLLLVAAGETSVGSGPLAIEVRTPALVITANTEAAIFKFSRRK